MDTWNHKVGEEGIRWGMMGMPSLATLLYLLTYQLLKLPQFHHYSELIYTLWKRQIEMMLPGWPFRWKDEYRHQKMFSQELQQSWFWPNPPCRCLPLPVLLATLCICTSESVYCPFHLCQAKDKAGGKAWYLWDTDGRMCCVLLKYSDAMFPLCLHRNFLVWIYLETPER